jgi:Tfp pilus assembly protein FimT
MPSVPLIRRRPRAGQSTIEQLAVLTITGLVAMIAIASGVPLFDHAAVHTAARETTDLLAYARDHAMATGQRTAVRLDAAARRVVVHAGADTIARGDFAHTGVELRSSRDSLAYAPTGLGVGAANLRVILARGAVADTITVSRLGRVQAR